MLTAILVLFIFDMAGAISVPGFVYGTLLILKLVSFLLALWSSEYVKERTY